MLRVKDFNKWDLQPRLLTNEEIANSLKMIHKVFDYAHLPDLRNHLWEWLKTTVSGNFNKSSLHFRDRESLLALYERMQKLLEAAHLLLVAKNLTTTKLPSPNKQEVSDDLIESVPVPAAEVKPIVDRLVHLLAPDFISELGKVAETGTLPVYHFIIALPGTASRTYADCQELVETACAENATVQLLTIKTVDMQRHLQQGHLLISRFCREPYLLYQKEGINLPEPTAGPLLELVANAEKGFDLVQQKAVAFYEGAVFYLSKDNHSLAVFMLQQAAEQVLRGFLQTLTGRNCTGHDLTVLRQQASPFFPGLAVLLPVSKDRNTCLLYRLSKAYVQARYDTEFIMPVSEISQLKEWVENLLAYTKPVLMRHIHALLPNFEGPL